MSNVYTKLAGVTPENGLQVYSGTGNVYWVNGGAAGSDTNPGTRSRPFASVDYAIGRCSANNGDVIMVMPGYTETLDGAADWAVDVAGVTIKGLGNANQRPQLTIDIAAAVTVSAANAVLDNLVFIASAADVAGAVSTTAANTTVKNCLFKDEGAGLNFDTCIAAAGTTNNDNDGLTVVNCAYGTPDTGSLNFITLAKDVRALRVVGNRWNTAATATVEFIEQATSSSVFDSEIAWNFVQIKDTDSVIGLMAGASETDNTGIVHHNYLSHLDTAGELMTNNDTGLQFNANKASGVITAQGYTLPTADDGS